MTEIKRITPEQVREAFVSTGLTPKQGEFLFSNKCGCGLGAIFAQHRSKEADEDHKDVIHTIREWNKGVIHEFDLTAHFDEEYGMDYRVGFVHGFDGIAQITEDGGSQFDERHKLGYEDGINAWKAVQDLIPPVTI